MTRAFRVAFIVLMLGLTVLFAGLGTWQMQRLGEKEALIATVETGLRSDPVPLETVEGNADYRPVIATGTYIPDAQVLVFTNLADPKGQYGGPGYWVMTPLALDAGGTLFVNRGFIPQDRQAASPGEPLPAGRQELTGLLRTAEEGGSFTPAADTAKRIDWIRDPKRLAALSDSLPQPVLPWFLDLPAGDAGALPQGGETVIEFPNNHLGYAITWFGFAILTPILLGFWIARQRKGAAPSGGSGH